MRAAEPASRVNSQTRAEKALTARSWRRFHSNSVASPAARMAEVKHQRTTGDKINADLDNDALK